MAPKTLVLLICLFLPVQYPAAGPLTDTVKQIEFELLQQSLDNDKVNRLLNGYGRGLKGDERKAAAVLIALGALDPEDLGNRSQLPGKLARYVEVMQADHPAMIGRIGDAVLPLRIPDAWQHDELLAGEQFLEVLGEKLAEGVITGYDVRRKAVYDGFPPGHTFIYSQSSPLHMQQLVALLNSDDVNGWLYITPKLSAFLYREDWGPASNNVKTLSSGVRVIQGREIAAMFEFDTPGDRVRFHELVTQYAKKDEKDETGLIANAWWQPFYYTDTLMDGFKPISLVIVTAGEFEATLTVLEPKASRIVDALDDYGWEIRIDRVWVNPPFYRFLTGGYK